MKILFTLLFTLTLFADEITRMESLVEDIQVLSVKYNTCVKSLNTQIQKTDSIKVSESKKYQEMLHQEKDVKNKIFEKQVKDLNNIIEIKEKSIINLKKEIDKLKKVKVKRVNTLVLVEKKPTVCVDDNIFPQLVMKETKTSAEEKETTFKPAAFRLLRNSSIFNSVNGTKLKEWESETSFTSNTQTKNWMKITGFFIQKQWQKSQEELWIKKENIVKR